LDDLVGQKPDLIIHLAAIVSGQAEDDFDLGYRVNLDGSRFLLDAIRKENYRPKVLFASSIAVFGAPFPQQIDDDYLSAPLTSYGTQKAITELLVTDYTRKGILDGLSIRLPTICVRPGTPNAAASGFFSNIIREPLVGKTANLPVSRDVRHWHASPRAAVGFFDYAAGLDLEKVGARRALSMPGLSVTVGEQIEALIRIAGADVAKLITENPDEKIQAIVRNWPENFAATRAIELGFQAETRFDDIIRIHIEDELS
jgi:nucleoside-diphosphate-sugar epimerase